MSHRPTTSSPDHGDVSAGMKRCRMPRSFCSRLPPAAAPPRSGRWRQIKTSTKRFQTRRTDNVKYRTSRKFLEPTDPAGFGYVRCLSCQLEGYEVWPTRSARRWEADSVEAAPRQSRVHENGHPLSDAPGEPLPVVSLMIVCCPNILRSRRVGREVTLDVAGTSTLRRF